MILLYILKIMSAFDFSLGKTQMYIEPKAALTFG